MQKIPTLFERDWDGDRSRVLDVPLEECGWVLAGEGVATRKYDGTSCLVRDGALYKRAEVKHGRPIPEAFEEVDRRKDKDENDILTGWVPVGDGPEDQWHREAWNNAADHGPIKGGTYELCGPKIQGNPEGFDKHILVPHAAAEKLHPERTFDGLRAYLDAHDLEGIVFHHPDGRMAKIKARDFGLRRPA